MCQSHPSNALSFTCLRQICQVAIHVARHVEKYVDMLCPLPLIAVFLRECRWQVKLLASLSVRLDHWTVCHSSTIYSC